MINKHTWYPHFSRGICCISTKWDGKRLFYVRNFLRGFKMNPLVLNPSWVTDLIVLINDTDNFSGKKCICTYTQNVATSGLSQTFWRKNPYRFKYPYTDLWYSVSIFIVTQRVNACGNWPFCRGTYLNQTKIKLEMDMK